MIDYVVIENWYENPDEIRSFALKKFKETKSSGEDKINDDGYPGYAAYP